MFVCPYLSDIQDKTKPGPLSPGTPRFLAAVFAEQGAGFEENLCGLVLQKEK
jgi:hypothetical protein